jgi:hypothetical protein
MFDQIDVTNFYRIEISYDPSDPFAFDYDRSVCTYQVRTGTGYDIWIRAWIDDQSHMILEPRANMLR